MAGKQDVVPHSGTRKDPVFRHWLSCWVLDVCGFGTSPLLASIIPPHARKSSLQVNNILTFY